MLLFVLLRQNEATGRLSDLPAVNTSHWHLDLNMPSVSLRSVPQLGCTSWWGGCVLCILSLRTAVRHWNQVEACWWAPPDLQQMLLQQINPQDSAGGGSQPGLVSCPFSPLSDKPYSHFYISSSEFISLFLTMPVSSSSLKSQIMEAR